LNTIKEIEQISEATRREIAHFFTVYKQLENKTVKVGDYKGSAPAQSIIEESVKQYNRKHEKK
ncbi:MAG: inorganic diphosphatase, partial [Acidobacteriota bacterium]